ncbi:MAG: hypothetical protein ACPW60_09440 [Methylohalobius sp. ZOD2]
MTYRKMSKAIVLSLGLSLISGGAHAITINQSLNGIWWEGQERWGRGIIVEVVDKANGQEIDPALTIDWFTYDNGGNQIWLHGAAPIAGSSNAIQVPLQRFTGGRFDDQHRFADTSAIDWGNATFTFNTCDSATVNFQGQDGSGSMQVSRFSSLEGSQCVHEQAFQSCPDFSQPLDTPGFCLLQGTITQDVTLTNDITWVLQGGVFIGNDNANSATITIEPGTRIIGQQGPDFLWIRRGSKINAVGTPQHPIIFTGTQEQAPGEWGGLVIAGNAPVNGCNETVEVCETPFEAITSELFGGNNPHESSGVLKYVQLRYAGNQVRPDEELNALTLLGVGDGTLIDYVQSHEGLDDGVEMFGGTVKLKHIVLTNIHDDSLDWGSGWTGSAQFVLAKQREDDADRCIEADNNEDAFDSQPRSKPTISNMTCIGSPISGQGFELRRGTGANIYNSVIVNSSTCIRVSDEATFTNAGTPDNLTGELTIQHSYVDCPNNFADGNGATFAVSDWFAAQAGNVASNPQLDGFLPAEGSPLINGGTSAEGLDPADFVGAFKSRYDDWTFGWTTGL